MHFNEIYGQPALWTAIQKGFEAGMAAHAFLLVGPRGSGKKTAAEIMAAAALCSAKTKPCGVCGGCKRVQAGTHPDLLTLTVSKKSKSGIITVDNVRELIESMAVKPYEGGSRVVLVHSAHRINIAGQNALLKSLEEPAGETLFLLLAEQLDPVLPTIRSRCQVIRMGRIPRADFDRGLAARGVEPGQFARLYELSDGILGRALEIFSSPEYSQMEQTCIEILNQTCEARDVPAALAAVQKIDAGAHHLFLELMEFLLRSSLYENETSAAGLRPQALLRGFTSTKLHSIMKEVISCRKRLNANVAWTSAVEPLLWSLIGG